MSLKRKFKSLGRRNQSSPPAEPLQPRPRRDRIEEEHGRGRGIDNIEVWVLITIGLITLGMSLGRCWGGLT